ncbi:flavin reductase family protein [Arthrobacter sp. ISL-72]|uniref:flavin reductase family protein n=1 Tax=Arthrobacter sp. ISL-72 TaxID=2819114 RepID=UPI001BECF7EB|nr:flavin reductase family protein [Arthrobacter sp. ISL-72]MBT2596891.1 flavin reductase family protein [Arthrobacter sp. ISL-72]
MAPPQHVLATRQLPHAAKSHYAEMLSVEDFKAAFRNHPAGVSIITAQGAGGPVGLTASSVISVSVNPPLLVFSLSAHSASAPAIRGAGTVVVHLLGADQIDLAKTFATGGIDRFEDTSTWSRLVTGEPVLPRANAWLRGRIVNEMDAGDSTVVAVHVLQVNIASAAVRDADQAGPLVYHNRSWHSLSADSTVG